MGLYTSECVVDSGKGNSVPCKHILQAFRAFRAAAQLHKVEQHGRENDDEPENRNLIEDEEERQHQPPQVVICDVKPKHAQHSRAQRMRDAVQKVTSRPPPEPEECTVYNPVYGRGREHIPQPTTNVPSKVYRDLRKVSRRQRHEEKDQRAERMRNALRALNKRRKDRSSCAPSSSSFTSHRGVMASSSQSQDPCTDACLSLEVIDDETEYDELNESDMINDFGSVVNPSNSRTSWQQTTPKTVYQSVSHDPCPSTDQRSVYTEYSAAPIQTHSRSASFVSDSYCSGDSDEDGSIYDVGYVPGDTVKFRFKRLGTKQFRTDHSKDQRSEGSTETPAPAPTGLQNSCHTRNKDEDGPIYDIAYE